LAKLMVKILGNQPSILNNYLNELRDTSIQSDPLRFRRNLERIGECIGIELSKTLNYQSHDVVTPLGVKKALELSDQIVLGTILRASLPMHHGLLNIFDRAENAFLAAYRATKEDGSVYTELSYSATPNLEGKVLILADPMLATGQSMVDCLNLMLKFGKPSQIHLIAAISSQEGLNFVKQNVDDDVLIWLGDVDEELNDKFYIVPGLGDAGDLAFGEKLGGE